MAGNEGTGAPTGGGGDALTASAPKLEHGEHDDEAPQSSGTINLGSFSKADPVAAPAVFDSMSVFGAAEAPAPERKQPEAPSRMPWILGGGIAVAGLAVALVLGSSMRATSTAAPSASAPAATAPSAVEVATEPAPAVASALPPAPADSAPKSAASAKGPQRKLTPIASAAAVETEAQPVSEPTPAPTPKGPPPSPCGCDPGDLKCNMGCAVKAQKK
jgi:hypothetical protein